MRVLFAVLPAAIIWVAAIVLMGLVISDTPIELRD
jgi:hypothetical protein